MESKKRTIVIFSNSYLPGYKYGGPLRTISNLCDCLGEEYQFRIIANDRDYGETTPYSNIKYDEPNYVGNAEVWYLKPGGFTFSAIQKLTKDADLIYCCGPYDNYAYKSMFLKRLNRIKQPLVIASMGTFSKGAIAIKSWKKKLFFGVCKFFGFFKRVVWSATSELEKEDIQRYIGKKATCYIAEDLPRKISPSVQKEKRTVLHGVFLSRICQMKNLLYAIETLKGVKSPLVFDIYGIIEDAEYWGRCQNALQGLPSNITWAYKGAVAPERVVETFSAYDFFLFPTLGENYGHVIYEALAGGCMPIISDQTPWLDLQAKQVGYVLPLKDGQAFVTAIEELCALPNEELASMQGKAHQYAVDKYNQSVENTGYREVFSVE